MPKDPKDKKDPDEIEDEIDPEEDDDLDEDEDDDKKSKTKVIRITQDDLSDKMVVQMSRGIRKGKREVLKELGFDTVEDAKKALIPPKSKDGDENDDKSRDAIAASEAATKAAERVGKIASAESLLTRRLTIAGINPEKLEAALKILGPEEHLDSEKDDADEAIDELKDKMPELFKSEDDEDEDEDGDGKPTKKSTKKRAPRSSTGGAPRKRGEPSTTDRVQDRLQKRHGAKLASNKQ